VSSDADFPNHFGRVAEHYAAARPRYPAALFDWLADQASGHRLCWDVGTGSGQAATALAELFDLVVASDASPEQIAAATAHQRLQYRLATAEHSGLSAASVDLITVAQALHWFDLQGFYREVRRVLRPGGLLAVWSYGVFHADLPEIDQLLMDFYAERVGPYWPPERQMVENSYRDLPFPFPEIAAPRLDIELHWTMSQLLDYLRSWSATGRFRAARGFDPVIELESGLQLLWGKAGQTRAFHWPLAIRAGHAPG